MTIFDRFNIGVVAGVGLCGAAIALSPDAAAVPYMTGGGACMYGQAGEAGAPAAGGPVGAAGAAAPCAAPLTDMAGIPMVVPGPAIVPVPAGAPLIALGPPIPPVPLGAPLPLGAPIGAPLPLGAPLVALGGVADGIPVAPLIDMSGVKDAPTGPAPTGGPVAGQPVSPGPSPVHGG